MKNSVQLNAQTRTEFGKRPARRMRRELDRVPGVVYGAGKDTQAIHCSAKELQVALTDEATYSSILTLRIEGEAEQPVILKKLHRHPSRPRLLHIDLLRVDMTKSLNLSVPIHLINSDAAPGIKEGGVLSHSITEIEIQCLPTELPENIELDIGALNIGESVHLSQLALPKGVMLVASVEDEEHDQPVVSILKPHAPSEEELAEETAAPEAPETEVTGQKEPEADSKSDS